MQTQISSDLNINTKKIDQKGKAFTELEGIRQKLFLDRYALKDPLGQPIEKYPEEMWRRVSHALSRVEKSKKLRDDWGERFFNSMRGFRFCPAGRFLTSAGTDTDTTMINCFVIPSPEDSRPGIIKTLEQVTEISARGGGVGFNLSSLRPRGAYLKNINGTSSGAVSWGEIYSVAAHDIIQQGGTRRGALMMMLWDWHPDLMEFITVKKEKGKILGANLSVCITDKFMEAVENDLDWDLMFPDTDFEKYRSEWHGDLENWQASGYPVKVHKTVKAKLLWDMICDSAWASAEPGIVFMDRYNKMNNTWYFEKNIATNPCGEQGLPAWGVCNLSSINLSTFVKEGKFDYKEYAETIKVGVRFLDNAVDSEKYLYKEIEETQKKERRVGLGTIGLADALIKMKIRYGSEESIAVIDRIYKMLRDVAYETSIELAKEKGAFPMFIAKKYLKGGFTKTLPKNIRDNIKKHGIRNALIITQAPTGKISLMADVSSGIEPVFSFSYIQKDRLGERTMYHSLYQEWINSHPSEELPNYFVVADDLTPEEHVNIQSIIQKYTDSSISKTVNAPENHSVDDVKKLYRLAYENGCKGISYMREGSREGTLVRTDGKTDGVKTSEKNGKDDIPHKTPVWQRPLRVQGSTYRLKTPVGTAFITVNHDEFGGPFEVFINVGRAGSDVQAMAEALGRVISKSLRFENELTNRERALLLVEQLRGIGGSRTIGYGAEKIFSLPDAIAKALSLDMGLTPPNDKKEGINPEAVTNGNGEKTLWTTMEKEEKNDEQLQLLMKEADICPSCGNATLVSEMGCKTCHGCGYAEC